MINNVQKQYQINQRCIELDIYSFLNTLSLSNKLYILCYINRTFLFRFRYLSNLDFKYNGFCDLDTSFYEVRHLNNELILKFNQLFTIHQYLNLLSKLSENLLFFTITPSSLHNFHIDVIILPTLPNIDQITNIPLITFLSKKHIIRENKRILLLKKGSYCEYKSISNIVLMIQQINKNNNTYINVNIVFSYS